MTLSRLEIGSLILEPEFNPNIKEYVVTWPSELNGTQVPLVIKNTDPSRSVKHEVWMGMFTWTSNKVTFDSLNLPKTMKIYVYDQPYTQRNTYTVTVNAESTP